MNFYLYSIFFLLGEKCFTRERNPCIRFHDLGNFCISFFSYSRGEDNLIVAIIPFVLKL
jgi:hypothetical protein